MKDFLLYVKMNSVKKQAPDINLARSTARDGLERLEMAKSILQTQKPKYCLENAYESIREIIDAILYLEGYKSYSHEASVSYLLKLGFSLSESLRVDWLRRKRNGIKYYGEEIPKEEAEEALNIADRVIKRLIEKRSELK